MSEKIGWFGIIDFFVINFFWGKGFNIVFLLEHELFSSAGFLNVRIVFLA